MRTLLKLLLPGVIATAAALAIGAASLSHAQTQSQKDKTNAAIAAAQAKIDAANGRTPQHVDYTERVDRDLQSEEAPRYVEAPPRGYAQERREEIQAQRQATPQILVCGVCGAQLAQPQVVMVAEPINGGRGRYVPREAYATDGYYPEAAYYPEPAYCPAPPPIAYAPAYYENRFSDPFSEVRVNPIPYPVEYAPRGRLVRGQEHIHAPVYRRN
jgi:hypothetical protein